MKLFLLLFISINSWAACAGANGFSFCQELTIDHTKVPSDLTNYPAAICFGVQMGSNCLTNARQLATVASSGFLQNASGFDFILTSDSGATIPLNYEVPIHDINTGATEIWVLLPSVSSTVDLTIYLFYGNASITTDQSNATAVWDSDYLAVHHFARVSGVYSNTDTIPDSTTANPFTVTTNFPTFPKPKAITAIVGGGTDFGVTSGPGICCGFENNGPFTNFPPTLSPAPFTLEGWFNTNGKNATDQSVYCFGSNSATSDRWDLFWQGSTTTWFIESLGSSGSFSGELTGWHRIVSVLPSGQSNIVNSKVYIDGVSQTITGSAGGGTVTFAPLYTDPRAYSAGFLCGTGGPFDVFAGFMDELRLSKIERSQDWITTDYNNQSNVKAFWSESTSGTGNAGKTIIIN